MRNEERVRPLPDHGPKGRIDVPFAACTQEINLLVNGMRGRLYIPNIGLGSLKIITFYRLIVSGLKYGIIVK